MWRDHAERRAEGTQGQLGGARGPRVAPPYTPLTAPHTQNRSSGYDEALEALRHAHDLDPLAPVVMSDIASTLLRAGRYDEASTQANDLINLEPAFPMAHSTLGWARITKGLGAEGVPEIQQAVALSPGSSRI